MHGSLSSDPLWIKAPSMIMAEVPSILETVLKLRGEEYFLILQCLRWKAIKGSKPREGEVEKYIQGEAEVLSDVLD